MTDEKGLTVKNLRKTFDNGRVVGVESESYSLNSGEFFTLVGPSGCGKSTTLNCVAGLEVPDHGEIEINGETVFSKPEDSEVEVNKDPAEREVGMVFQSYAIYPHMTVRDNIVFPLEINDVDEKEIKEKLEEIADIIGLGDLLDRKPSQLSGGQRQRVALGRAMVVEPRIFLLDEPLANLDAKLRVQMRAELAKIHEKIGITVLYVTHDQEEAMSLSDKIAVMNEGRIEQIGTPEELYNEPVNHFVADFIGSPSMNFLDVDLVEDKGNLYLSFENAKILVPDSYYSDLQDYIGEEIELGIRPQDVQLLDDRKDFTVEGKVEVIETIGADRLIHLKTVNTHMNAITRKSNIERGDELYIKFNQKKMHMFDKDSKQSIANLHDY